MQDILQQGSSQEQSDRYQYIVRDSFTSLKHFLTLSDKSINVLDKQSPKQSLKNMPIVVSYADLDFKIDKKIQNQWIRRLSNPHLILGYQTNYSTRGPIADRIKKNTGFQCKQEQILLISSMLTLHYLVIRQFTQKGDKVLVFTPTYYRFLEILHTQQRNVVEYQLQTKKNQDEQLQYFIDFYQLAKLFQQNQIKMMIFVNPHNPTGKIWNLFEMTELKNLCLKFNCLIFSDDIFWDSMLQTRQNYCSFLNFPEIQQNHIWASSFGKAFNCSENSCSYIFARNKKMRQKIFEQISKMNVFPTFASCQLLESCYSVGQDWRASTINYIMGNNKFLKEEVKKRGLKLGFYKLESAFLLVIDFKEYKWPYSQIKRRLQSQNIFATYLDNCFVNREKQSVSCVRINLGINRNVLRELSHRLQKAINQ